MVKIEVEVSEGTLKLFMQEQGWSADEVAEKLRLFLQTWFDMFPEVASVVKATGHINFKNVLEEAKKKVENQEG